MNFKNILVISNKKIVKNSYEAMLQEYGKVVFEQVLTFEDLSLNNYEKYDLFVIDMEIIQTLQDILFYLQDIEVSKKLLIVIAPFDIYAMQKLTNLEDINFFIQKPYAPAKLLSFLDKQLQKKYQLSIVTQKADVLIDIIDHYPSDVGIFDNTGKVFYANESYQKYFQLDITDKNLYFDDFYSEKYTFNYIKSKLFISSSYQIEYETSPKNWCESLFFFSSDNYLIHILTNISEKKHKQLNLELKNLFFENTSEGVMITDSKGVIESVNDSFTKITGYLRDDVIGKKPNILKSNIHDNCFYEKMWKDIRVNKFFKGEIWNKRKNGQIYPQLLSITKSYNIFNDSYYYLALFTDLSSLKEADKKVYYYANYDSLTKLPNRSYFYKQFQTYLKKAQENEDKLALLFIDLDKFKDVNDTYGHSTGDKMLQIVSKRLSNSIREDDFLARLGGDEFVVILDKIKDNKSINIFAQKLQKRVGEKIEIDNHIFEMTLSIGIALYPEHGEDEKKLLQNADIAMYEVKNNGRTGTEIFSEEMFEKISSLVCLKEELQTALQKGEICFFYQPIVDFKSNKIVGLEALVRWNHPKKGYLSPDKFLSILLQKDLQHKFTEYFYEMVFKEFNYINKQVGHSDMVYAINITKEQFYDELFCSKIASKLKKYNIKANQLEVEIVEDQLIHDKQKAQLAIQNLKNMGISVALDDFGTGYSNIAYLRDFEVSKLKIDQLFIKNIINNKKDQLLTKSIIYYAKIFDMSVQAEGICSKEHFELVKEYECDLSQGFYHSKPLELNEIVSLLKL
ncbi:MAG: EAL domain-containing protein [Campylobacterota bacterium]